MTARERKGAAKAVPERKLPDTLEKYAITS